jgi:hypothetical protein
VNGYLAGHHPAQVRLVGPTRAAQLQRQPDPQRDEDGEQHARGRDRADAADDDIEHQQHAGQHGADEADQPCQSQSVAGPDELALAPALEHQTVYRDGGDEQRSGQCRSHQREHVQAALEGVDVGEPVHESQGQQEREEDLHAGLGDPQFLEQLREIPVGPLKRCFGAVFGVPIVAEHQWRLHDSPPDHVHIPSGGSPGTHVRARHSQNSERAAGVDPSGVPDRAPDENDQAAGTVAGGPPPSILR